MQVMRHTAFQQGCAGVRPVSRRRGRYGARCGALRRSGVADRVAVWLVWVRVGVGVPWGSRVSGGSAESVLSSAPGPFFPSESPCFFRGGDGPYLQGGMVHIYKVVHIYKGGDGPYLQSIPFNSH